MHSGAVVGETEGGGGWAPNFLDLTKMDTNVHNDVHIQTTIGCAQKIFV